MSLRKYFHFKNLMMNRIRESEIDETVSLINPAYGYQDQAKGRARTDAEHLRKRASETHFYVVKDGGGIVGCVYVEPSGGSLHFGLLTLADHYRKTGLAQAIMKAIEDFAGANRYESLELDYMSLAPWLKKYYERYGFIETGVVINWGSIDLIHMSKKL
ncbi:MAG TPA: GNAT family N-acetyltransferase [Candidatus Saccharimonadia bacterium]|jgi:GNAT superfamily N-acetyltransferase